MRALIAFGLVLSLCVAARADAPSSSTGRHLLAGVRAFKAGQYEDAYVELQVVARAKDAPADLAFYLGPTLYKLARYHEALEVFVTSHAPADVLTDFYLGETYYQLKLYRKARALFVGLRARGLGPVLDDGAARYVEAIDVAFKAAPPAPAIDFYLQRGLELGDRDPAAGEYLDEARQVEALASERHRRAEIFEALARTWNATGRAQIVVEVLGSEPGLTAETRWQLARAYVAVGDPRARVQLQAIVKTAGAHANEATALLANLAP